MKDCKFVTERLASSHSEIGVMCPVGDIHGEVKDLAGRQIGSRGKLITVPVAVATWPDRRCHRGHSGDLNYATL
jgi:hypothetical protein